MDSSAHKPKQRQKTSTHDLVAFVATLATGVILILVAHLSSADLASALAAVCVGHASWRRTLNS